MDRSFFSTVFRTLIGITTASTLAFAGTVPNTPPEPPRPDATWRLLTPITYENITLFPVVSNTTADTSIFLTLDEGLSSGEVVVSEQGSSGLNRSLDRGIYLPSQSSASVNQLVLINRSKRPLLLLAGELVSGGKQDRIIAKDRIVAPGADPLPLDVFCVEHGRWSSGSQFAAAKTIVHPSVREQAALSKEQTDVWNAVRAGSTAQGGFSADTILAAPVITPRRIDEAVEVAAPTQSYAKIYESSRVASSADDLVAQLQKRLAKATATLKGEQFVGVIVAYGGEVAWSDIFASSDLFDRYQSKLIRSYAVEALARPTLREVATTDDASQFLRRLNGREIQESEPNVYRWRETSEGKLALIELDALQPKLLTIHRLLVHRTSEPR
jgi:hypothetical protein